MMKGALRRAGFVACAAIALGVGAVPATHADGLDDFDVGGIIEDLSVLTEVGVWPEADAAPAPPPAADAEPPQAEVESPSVGETSSNVPARMPSGLPETGAGAGASRDSLTLIVGLATVLATAGLALGASSLALSKRPAA